MAFLPKSRHKFSEMEIQLRRSAGQIDKLTTPTPGSLQD
jgi:hypothetical protein